MARFEFLSMLMLISMFMLMLISMFMLMLALTAAESGPKVEFFNYSGMQATISCVDHPSRILEAGATFYVPLTRGNQACMVTLKDGEHASAVIDEVLPRSSNSGLSVDINDTFLFALDETVHHQYVNFLNTQDEQIQPQKSSDLQL